MSIDLRAGSFASLRMTEAQHERLRTMRTRRKLRAASALLYVSLIAASALTAQSPDPDSAAERLVGAMLGDTPLVSDLEILTDRFGGRPTGSANNQRAFDWAATRFRDAGVTVRKEAFRMPGLWLERSASATVQGDGVRFSPRVVALPFSTPTARGGLTAPLADAGHGTEADFARLGAAARGAIVLIETDELRDMEGLFREYNEAVGIERRAIAAGAAGLVYMSSRPDDLLARHNASLGLKNRHPMMMMERDGAARALRLIRAGTALTLTAALDVQTGPAYQTYNVIGEIRGSTRPRRDRPDRGAPGLVGPRDRRAGQRRQRDDGAGPRPPDQGARPGAGTHHPLRPVER